MKRLYDKALVDEIAKKYGNEAMFLSDFSRALLDIIREGLIRDGLVRLHQFGTFRLKWMKSREGVHPSTGKKMTIKGRPRVIFTPAKYLKNIIEPNPADLLPIDALDRDEKEQVAEIATASSGENETLVIQLKSEESEQSEPANPVTAEIEQTTEQVDIVSSAESNLEPEAKSESEFEAEPVTERELASESTAPAIIDEAIEEELEAVSAPGYESSDDAAIADISDEINVLEQVVEILKNEPVEEDNLEDSHKDKVVSEWLDEPVVDQIRQISELQYFKSDVGQQNKASKSRIVTDEFGPAQTFDDAVTEQSSAEKDSVRSLTPSVASDGLDIDLSESANEQERENGEAKPWFAIAAAIVVLLATGLLVNSLWKSGDESAEVKYLYSYYPQDTHEDNIVVADTTKTVTPDVVETADESDQQTAAVESTLDETVSESTVPETIAVEDKAVAEDDQIIVSDEQYNEVKRASAEESVFFLERDYRLVDGDSLWRLAKKHYVNPFYWPHIYQANHKKIDNPDRVKIGKMVLLPTLYGDPDHLTRKDRRNIAMGYYFNYLYHKQKGNPFAYFSLIGVDKFDPGLLIEFKEEISRSDVNNLALLSE